MQPTTLDIRSMEVKSLITKDNDVISTWKPKRSSRQLQGSAPFPSSRRAHQRATSFSDPRPFQVHSKERVSFFSTVRLLNRDIITLSSQWYYSWKIHLWKVVWKYSKVLSTISLEKRVSETEESLGSNSERIESYWNIKHKSKVTSKMTTLWVAYCYSWKKCLITKKNNRKVSFKKYFVFNGHVDQVSLESERWNELKIKSEKIRYEKKPKPKNIIKWEIFWIMEKKLKKQFEVLMQWVCRACFIRIR